LGIGEGVVRGPIAAATPCPWLALLQVCCTRGCHARPSSRDIFHYGMCVFQLKTVVGKGASKTVYEADDMETGRRVAWNEVGRLSHFALEGGLAATSPRRLRLLARRCASAYLCLHVGVLVPCCGGSLALLAPPWKSGLPFI
jgi:hypothetical protein